MIVGDFVGVSGRSLLPAVIALEAAALACHFGASAEGPR